jgi:hypothetical protein
MANTSAICTSFKVEILNGIHALGTTVTRGGTTADVIKGAIFLAAGSLGAGTTAYSVTNEIANTGNYSAGGATVTAATAPNSSGTTAFWTPSASIAFTGVTFSNADALLLYNSTQANKAVAVFSFGNQSVTAGNFTLSMPTNDATTGLIRLQ